MDSTTTLQVCTAHAAVARPRPWAYRFAANGQVCTFGHIAASGSMTPVSMTTVSTGTWKRSARHLGATIT